MSSEFKVIAFVLFIVFRIIVAFNKNNNKKKTIVSKGKSKKVKGLDDILGDFMKNIEAKQQEQTVLTNSSTHTAEEDSHKKVDWQTLDKTQIVEKKQLLRHSDYKNISHHNENISEIENLYSLENNNDSDFEVIDIDLKQAIIYKEILERKYFSV